MGGEMLEGLLRGAVISAYAQTFVGGYGVAMRQGFAEPVALVVGGLSLALLLTLLSVAELFRKAAPKG